MNQANDKTPSRPERWVSLIALVVFVGMTVGTAPFVASAFPAADLSEPLGQESVTLNLSAAIQLYAVLCATALLPAFLWFVWLRRFGGWLTAAGFGGRVQLGDFARGGAGGCALILVLCATLAGFGWYSVESGTGGTAFGWVLIGLVFAALYEELLFRGFGYWLLDRAAGPVFAIAASSVLFALAHSDNSGAHWVGMLNTALAGILLGVLRWRSGSLWSAWGVHLGWNVALGLLFGAKTSGFAFAGRLLEADVTATGARHLVLAGGAYGPEGSAVLTPLLVLWIVWLVRKKPDKLAAAPEQGVSPG